MINYLKQPNKHTCGQTTIAMIAGISIQESIELFGHDRTSYYKDYTRVLGELGLSFIRYKVDNRRRLNLPQKAIIRLEYIGRKSGHLLAYENGVFYDPYFGVFNSKEELLNHINRNKPTRQGRARIDWYLEILKPIKMGMVAR